MKLLEKNYKRIVIKVGSSLFYSQMNKLDTSASLSINPKPGKVERVDFSLLESIVAQVSQLHKEKKEIILVTSGAIALGMSVLGLESKPRQLSSLQAIAAIGQSELMNKYRELFKKAGINCAQILLTWEDFDERLRYLNAKNTLLTLLKLGSVPIINENDTISTDEIKFGDNDRLSALVASLINADLLIILSDVDGLLMKDGKTMINAVEEINKEIRSLALPTHRKTSVGGMITKIDAAKIAVDSGIPCIIANGKKKNIIIDNINNPDLGGTIFLPKKGFFAAKQRWIAFGTKPKGGISVDEGAKKALLNKKSLLSVGVTAAYGKFECGDIVSLLDKQDIEFARGKVCISCRQLEKVKGKRSEKEVAHCDNIVILD